MLALVLAVSAAVPVLDPDGTYPLPRGTDFRIGRPSQSAGAGFIGAKFSPDGKKLATLTRTGIAVRCAVTGRRLWGRDVLQLHGSGSADGLAFSPDGKRLAFVGFSRITVADLGTGKEVDLNARANEDGWFETSHVRFASRGVVRVFGRQRAAKKDDGGYEAVDFDPDTGGRLARRELPGTPIAVATDGQALLVRIADGFRRFDATVWRETGKPLKLPEGISLAGDADCKRVAWIAPREPGKVVVIDANTGAEVRTLSVTEEPENFDPEKAAVALSPLGDEILAWTVCTVGSQEIHRWCLSDGKELMPFRASLISPSVIVGIRRSVVIDRRGFIIWFDRETATRIGGNGNRGIVLSPNGTRFARYDGEEVIHCAETGRPEPVPSDPARAVSTGHWSPISHEEVRTEQLAPGANLKVAVSNKALHFLSSDPLTGGWKEVKAVPIPLPEPGEVVDRRSVAVSANGRVIAVGTDRYVDLFTGDGDYLRRVRIVPVPDEMSRLIHSDWARFAGPVALSADGRWLAVQHVSYIHTGGMPPSGAVEIYETATGGFVTKIEPRLGTPAPFTFAPSGRYLWTEENGEALRWSLKPPPAVVFNRANLLPDLGGDDARTAHLAAGRLAFPGMLKYLGEQLPPDKFVDPARVAKLVKQLGDRDFTLRETATATLTAMGPAVSAALRAEAKAPANVEAARRATAILGRIDRDDAPGVLLRRRAAHAVAMLADTHPDARKLLETWASGDPGLPLTVAARTALGR